MFGINLDGVINEDALKQNIGGQVNGFLGITQKKPTPPPKAVETQKTSDLLKNPYIIGAGVLAIVLVLK